MTGPNLDLDPRLLAFADLVRIRSDYAVAVEDNYICVGGTPNTAILHVHSDGKIWVSFHRECHPHTVLTLLLILFDSIETEEFHFANCFVSDVRGAVLYESEPGFELLHVQYLRDLLGIKSKGIFSA